MGTLFLNMFSFCLGHSDDRRRYFDQPLSLLLIFIYPSIFEDHSGLGALKPVGSWPDL